MDLSPIFQAILLGVVQGLTEFLPISSSGHLILIPWFFGWDHAVIDSLPFSVALHIGTLISVLAYFYQDWVRLVRAAVASLIERRIGSDPDRRLAWLILLGCVPGALVGALAESKVEEVFHAPNAPLTDWAVNAMAIIIALTGLALFVAERIAQHVREMSEIRASDALIIGAAQAAAIFPGVSRSGATLTAGLFLGLKRTTAARFSFMLGAPIIAGAGLKSLYNLASGVGSPPLSAYDLLIYFAGFAAAAVSGFLTIHLLLGYLQRHTTDIFVYYRWGLALLIAALAVLR